MWQVQTRSSFNGKIDEIPDVSVDNFERTDLKAYFLSHCHTDHTQGLFSDALLDHLKQNNVFVYMSEPSAAIIRHESGTNKDITEFIKPLKIGSTTITIPGDESNETDIQYITVNLIPANHCFGSVMFLFRTIYKTILYTGDFRISQNSVSKYAQLHKNGDIIKIDALYVDTTFYSPNNTHNDFPKRTDSVECVIREIREWLYAKDTNQVALYTPAKYGYEFVFNEIYNRLEQKVYVDDYKWKLYSQFPKQVTGVTNDPSNSRIHCCRYRYETKIHSNCLPGSFEIDYRNIDFLLVYFSALKWADYDDEKPMIDIKKGSDSHRIDVCFATHCSRSELEYFVNYLAPKKIVGFPNKYVKRNTEPVTPSKRTAPRSAEKQSPQVKVARMIDEVTISRIFSAFHDFE